eukprot:3231348-Amphidinium_carterae.2
MADSYRKMLGYHVQAGDRAMAEYSRDCRSAPMRELSRVYTAMQNEREDEEQEWLHEGVIM